MLLACYQGNENRVRDWLDSGVDVNSPIFEGRTALIVATQADQKAVVGLLLDRGADIEKADDRGLNPLITACVQGKEEMVRLLVDKGADIKAAARYMLRLLIQSLTLFQLL